ncbi:MAG: hypothetical protein IPM06_19485 [Rhizobiales bacterium]|nr:hypothetical protein [Hyphomicrobiales bacterium]
MGLGFTSALVAFTANTDKAHDLTGKFKAFTAGTTVAITGAHNPGNNASFEILSVDDRDPVSLVSSTILFDPANDIDDTAGDALGFLARDDAFLLSGSSANSGTHQLKTEGSGHVEISNRFFGGGLIVSEGIGPSITIARGNSIEVGGNLTDEAVGYTVTVTAWGKKVYTSFQHTSATAWTAAHIEIRMRKIGNPTDNVTVQLVTDSSGVPGTVHETVTLAPAYIPTEMGWVSFDLANTTSLSSATVYGITISRASSNSETDYYEVDMDEALSYSRGAVKLWDGAAWQTPAPDSDLAFRVLGAMDTGSQVIAILQGSGWATAISVAASGVVSPQWRDGELTRLDELNSLLDMGTSAAKRMLARVTRDLAVVVSAKPDSISFALRWLWRGAGKLTDNYGADAEPGYLPVGEWVRLGDAESLGPWSALSPVFVERAEYSIDGGLSLEPEGQADAYDMGVQQG